MSSLSAPLQRSLVAYYSEYLPQKTSSRQLNAQVQKQEIKAMTVHSVPLKW